MRIPAQARNSCRHICTHLAYNNGVQKVPAFAKEESVHVAFERYRLVYTALFLPPLKSKPRVERVVCTSPRRAYYWQASQEALKDSPTALLLQAAAKAACFYAFVFLLPVNGSMYSLSDIWSATISSCN